ncbi:MAG: bifunctional DNA-formamidopyrimidine glycosylase/DNA-(apurinic or apyrimidinic site) lyase [Pseudomonadota bacterium]
MPELPEVETVRRGLAPAMAGRRVDRLELRRADLRFPFPPRLAERVSGARIEALDRRAKYLLFHLDSGDTVLGHLGMSGRMSVVDAGAAATPGAFTHARATLPAHDHVVFHLETGAQVVFNDPRRFGYFDLVETGALQTSRWLADLGPEPLSEAFSPSHFASAFSGRRGPVKTALLDQTAVAGLGNIYVCEALWRARISPRRRADTAAAGARGARLVAAVKEVIAEAIEAGGSSLRDHAKADGSLGYFQNAHAVYGRDGEPCPRCANEVALVRQSGRSTFFCPTCQR